MSSKIYSSQTSLRIKLRCSCVLVDVSSAKIKYKKPDNTTGEWFASVQDRSIIYDLTAQDKLAEGIWTIWPVITFTDGRVLPGSPSQFKVYKKGEI